MESATNETAINPTDDAVVASPEQETSAPRTVHALCVVPPDLFDEVCARWPSFDWRSGEAYGETVRARADELYFGDDNVDVEIAIFDPDHFSDWCVACTRREDSSRSRADWAAAYPLRIPYDGSLEDLFMFDLLVACSREGIHAAGDEVRTKLEHAVDDLLDEFAEGGAGRGMLDIISYDHAVGCEGRTEYTWSFIVEWLEDDEGDWLSVQRTSETDIMVALLTMGLVNGGCVDLCRLANEPPARNSFLEPVRRRWTLGAHLDDLFAAEPGVA